MTLTLSEDQRLIREAAATFLKEACTSAGLRAAVASESGFDANLWRGIAEQGWCGVAVPEALGGLGLGPVAMALLLEQAGQHLLASPFFASAALGASLLMQVAAPQHCAALMPVVAEGRMVLSAALPSDVAGLAAPPGLVATSEANGGWSLEGQVSRLPDAQAADCFLLLATLPASSKPGLFLVPASALGLTLSTLPGFDATRRFSTATLQAVRAGVQRLDDPARMAEGLTRATALLRLYVAAEQLGSATACLDLTVAYTASRKQFGRAIHGFQAIKHRCAEMMVGIENLRSAVASAAAAAAADADSDAAALAAECAGVKALASDTLFHCAEEAIQLHGGVGFTAEYDVQLYFKRAQASGHWLGTAEALRQQVARHVFAVPSPAGRGWRAAPGEGARPTALTPSPLPALPGHPLPQAGEGQEHFRAEVALWMAAHLQGRFAPLRYRGGPGDEEADPALRKEWERELAAGGWTGVGWPKTHGGRGLSIAEQVIFYEEYARAGGPGRMGHIGEGLLGPALIKYGTAAQQQRFLPEILAGREYWAQGYSEPNAGSDLANVQTRCWQLADGSWRVQGQKIWTSLAHESDWIFVIARSEPGSKGNKGLSFLLLPLKQPGISIRPIEQMGGGREFNEVFFDEAVAEAGHIVGAPGEGWKVAMGLLEIERGVSTLGQQMHFAHELELVMAAAERSGAAQCHAIKSRIAAAWQGLKVLRAHALRMLAGDDPLSLGREALVYKYAWSNWHRDLGKLAMDVLGAEGEAPSDDPAIRPLQQLFFFSRADTIYGGTNEIQLNLIAERGLGMPREARPPA